MGRGFGTLVFGAMESGAVSGILAELHGLNAHVLFCKVGTMRGLAVEELVKSLPEEAAAECHGNLHEAMKVARKCGGPVLVAGSLFLIGEAAGGAAGLGFP